MTGINHLIVHLYHYDRHITMTWTRLDANLVTCDRLHALFSAFSYLLLLFMHCLSARALSPLHTHSLWSRSDDPGFARPAIGRLFHYTGVR